MQHILLPTDFSKAAQNAVDYAFSFFRESSCAFHFLNTYTPDFIHSRVMALASSGSPEEDAMQVASEEGLRNLIDSMSDQYPDSGFPIQNGFLLQPVDGRNKGTGGIA